MVKIIRKYWRKFKSLFKTRKLKSQEIEQQVCRRSWQEEMQILRPSCCIISRKISRSSLGTAVQSTKDSNTYGVTPSNSYNSNFQEEISIGSGFEPNSTDDYMPSIIREEQMLGNNYSSESFNRSLSRSISRKKKPAGQTLVEELERKKSIMRAALEPVRNPNVTTLVDVTPPNMIKKGTLLDSSVTLSRSKSRSRNSFRLVIEDSSDGLTRSRSVRRSKHDSAGTADSGLVYRNVPTSGYLSGNSLNGPRALALNNTSDESEDLSWDLQRKFLASTDGLTRQKTSSSNEQSVHLSRRKSRRKMTESAKEPSPDEIPTSRKKSLRRHSSLADARVDTVSLSRSRSMRNEESLSRRKSKKPLVVVHSSGDDDDVPLGLTLRRVK